MSSYIVTYDLHQTGQNYECIIQKLEAYDTHWHMQGSVWIISTYQTAVQIRDNLLTCLDSNDKLFVAEITRNAAWAGYNKEVEDWLNHIL